MVAAIAFVFAAPSAHAQPTTDIHPALFVARDVDSTLYLYGTIHARPPGAPWGSAQARAALAQADEIWTEVIISPEEDHAAQTLMLALGMAPNGAALTSRLTPDEADRLTTLAQRAGLPRSVLDTMRPWFAALTLSMAPVSAAGFDPQSGVDRAIDAEGDAAGKRMRALETSEQQLRVLADLPDDAQHQMLIDTIEDSESGASRLPAMLTAWESGDLETLDRLFVADARQHHPQMYDVLFKRRNAAWTEVLVREMDGAGVDFVAVGVGHLAGPDGLVEMLRARGVRVERVR